MGRGKGAGTWVMVGDLRSSENLEIPPNHYCTAVWTLLAIQSFASSAKIMAEHAKQMPGCRDDAGGGASAAAGQVEGAIALEGRTPSIDILERFITNGTGSDSNYIANENYFLYKQDIARMAAAGMKWYSFSISWSRILPFAKANTPVNKQAIDHYNDAIDTILAFGMQPAVTIQHFDSPYVFVDDQYPETSYSVRGSHPEAQIAPMAIQNKTWIWRFNGGFSHPE
jgi:hypothetical protein